jgi:signal peptidase II
MRQGWPWSLPASGISGIEDMRALLATALGIFVLDQASKWFVVFHLNLIHLGAIDVIPPYLNLRMVWNPGINFGLLAADSAAARWGLIAVALAISAGVTIWLSRLKAGIWLYIAGGLLVGGALGNVVDRILYGAVADFLNMSCCGIYNPFSFNVADVAIFMGAVGVAILGDRASPVKE